jgi:hypothetical protein
MKRMPGYKLVTPVERRRLRRELEQMWDTVPPQALAKARELAGVQPGKEHEFRIAVVKDQEGTCFIDYRVPINLRVWLVDGMVKGEKAKLLKVQLQCGERAWQINDGVYAKRFQSNEQLNDWLAAIQKYVLLHLLERLRDTCIYVWDEAVAKASDDHGVRTIDLTALAEAHVKELRREKSRALTIRRGAKKGSKHSKVYLSKRQVEVDLPKFIRENGEDTTRKEAAERFGLTNEKALDRALAPHGKRWRKLKVEAMMKTKKGH